VGITIICDACGKTLAWKDKDFATTPATGETVCLPCDKKIDKIVHAWDERERKQWFKARAAVRQAAIGEIRLFQEQVDAKESKDVVE